MKVGPARVVGLSGELFAAGLSLQAAVRLVTDEWAREPVVAAVEQLDHTIARIRTVTFVLEVVPAAMPGLRAGFST